MDLLDTDGDPSPLVRMWYEAGVDCMQPWEVNSVDMLRSAEESPEFVMMGESTSTCSNPPILLKWVGFVRTMYRNP